MRDKQRMKQWETNNEWNNEKQIRMKQWETNNEWNNERQITNEIMRDK